MAYTPTEWKSGDVITAEKLNKMEDGIANCGGSTSSMEVVVTLDGENAILNKTWQEIYDAFPNVFLSISEDGAVMKSTIVNVMSSGGQYGVETSLSFASAFSAESADDYPMGQPK